MKILICCSKHFYSRIPIFEKQLREMGHVVELPNSYEEPFMEEKMKKIGKQEHVKWKANMIRKQEEKVAANDAILVLNFEKNGMPNYIGGATFLEIFEAFRRTKKIYLLNQMPENIFKDELLAMSPIILDGKIGKIET